jgi:hypothetical protein
VEAAYGGDANAFRQWPATNGDDIDNALPARPQVATAYRPDLHLQADLLYDNSVAWQTHEMERLERSVWRDVGVELYRSDEETAVVAAWIQA